MVGMEEIGKLGCRVRPCHGIQRVKSVAVNPQGIRLHHAAQQRVAFHALVNQTLADYDTDVLQAAVADSRGKALSAGKKCLVQSAATWGMWMMQALKLMQDLPCASIVLLLCNAKV